MLPQIREKWLDHRDGMIIAVDIDRSILYLEEVPFVHNEQANDTLIPRLLPFMQSHIRPECITLAKQARDQHVHGIPLIDFYANGLTKKIKEIISCKSKYNI